MGPPAYADGDHLGARAGRGRGPLLQWGRRPTPTETSAAWAWRCRRTRFNGAAGLRRRRQLRRTRPSRSTRTGFNGAAGLRRRRLDEVIGALSEDLPLQWGRRPTPTETAWRPPTARASTCASMGPPAYADGD